MKIFKFLITIILLNSCNKKQENGLEKKDSLVYPFPFTSTNINQFESLSKNNDNIPLLSYQGQNHIYPITYTQAALFYFHNYYVTKNVANKSKFLNIANYIKNNTIIKDDFAVLQYNFKVTNYNYNLPAASSMSQGFAIGIMIQAYSLTNDKSYLNLAEKLLNSFGRKINEGGVLNYWDGWPIYEEYIDPNSHVLNGFIFSLSGLYYFYKTMDNKLAKKYFDDGIKTLKNKLPEYDATFTSYYNKLKNEDNVNIYASAINEDPDHYHELVIYQLLTLYHWTNEIEFKDFAHKFIKMDTGSISDYYEFKKYISINANHTIEPKDYGTDLLDDELWSWGNYWSTNKFATELILEFDEKRRDISAITFYSINQDSLPLEYDVFISDENGEWLKKYSAKNINKIDKKYYKTGIYETFIETHFFPQNFEAQKIKIVFNKSHKGNIISLREINVHFNREKELMYILDLVSKKDFLKDL